MLLRERLEAFDGRLTPADLAVLDVVLSQPGESSFLSASKVARRANVHVAAATRLAQKLGYDGYPELRQSLQSELLAGVGAADRMRNSLDQAHDEDIFTRLVAEEVTALLEAANAVDRRALQQAADRVLGARRILLSARGNAAPLAQMLERRFRRFGLTAIRLGPSDRDLAEGLVGLSKHHVVVVVALRRRHHSLVELLDVAREARAGTVLITDTVHTRLDRQPDVVLSAPRGEGREYQSLTVPMAVANALVLSVGQTGGERTMHALEQLDGLLGRFRE
ncbi:MAG: MurR/RpiR family transcriptional regulator [Actinomycetaceae bacterium]